MPGPPSIPVSTDASGPEVSSQDQTAEVISNPHSTIQAMSTMVFYSGGVSHRGIQTSTCATSADTGLRERSTSRRELPPPSCVEDLPEIKEVLDKSKKKSTILLYKYKWNNFLCFATARNLQTSPVSLQALLLYLKHLFDLGLTLSTLKVYISAIVSFQPRDSESSRLFSHPTLKAFLKGLINIRPPTRPPVPQWSLTLVLQSLMKHPFEPMASCNAKFLSLKTLFLVVVTSARRASELAALRSDSPYLQFYKDKVTLFPDVSVLPKVVTDFHLNQPISLPTLFPDPSSDVEKMLHSLDFRRVLAYYVSRTKDFRKSERLFLCFFGPHKGCPASSSTLLRWLVSTVTLAYQLASKEVPEGLKGHSTRSMATSTALLRGVDIPDICKAATWSRVSTFVIHYRLDLRAKKKTSFGRAVLTFVLQ
nr:uncharacterized protein LOC110073471 [Pogona vitticeps]